MHKTERCYVREKAIFCSVCYFLFLERPVWASRTNPTACLCRYDAASCATEQVPSRFRPGREERPVLRWHPRVQGHMGQLLLRREPQVCCHHHRCQRWRSLYRSSPTKGEWWSDGGLLKRTIVGYCPSFYCGFQPSSYWSIWRFLYCNYNITNTI